MLVREGGPVEGGLSPEAFVLRLNVYGINKCSLFRWPFGTVQFGRRGR